MNQIAVRGVHLDHASAGGQRPGCGRPKGLEDRGDAGLVEGRRHRILCIERVGPGPHGNPAALGERNRALSVPGRLGRRFAAGMRELRSHAAPCSRQKRAIRARPSTCASCQMPRSTGEMRPSAVTAIASVSTSPAPPTARLPRCARCQSLEKPSVEEYSHIGETETRLRSVSPRKVSGEKRTDAAFESLIRASL